MGTRGPAPKRSDQRLGHRSKADKSGEGVTKADFVPAEAPPADDEWHRVAKLWYESLGSSGQARFYQASDWGQAYVLAEAISRELSPQPIVVGSGESATIEMHEMPMKGATLSAFLKGCTDLLVSEAARRRAAVELQLPSSTAGQPAPVTDIRSWREGLNA